MTRRIVLSVWSAFAVLGIAAASGLHVNVTPSMPQGIWQQRPYAGVVRPGEAVVVCLPSTEQTRRYIGTGACQNGLEPLLKTVGAVAGDVVELRSEGVTVNGRAVPSTAALTVDEAGRHLTAYPAGVYRVQSGQVFLFSSHDPVRCYDSRYFGPVSTTTIIAIGKPVLTLK